MKTNEKIGIVFQRRPDNTYEIRTIGDYSNIDNNYVIMIDEEKLSKMRNRENVSFVTKKNQMGSNVTFTFSDSVLFQLDKICERYQYDSSKKELYMKQLLEKLFKQYPMITFEERGNLESVVLSENVEKDEERHVSNVDVSSINPIGIIKKIKEKVIAQDEAVATIVNNIYNNQLIFDTGDENIINTSKSSILMDGPTGTGKTLIVKEVAKEMNLPMIIRSSTMYSAAGYKGSDLSELLTGLLEKTDGDLELAERGIIVLDEFDKLGGENSELEMKKAVQQELLTYLSGAKFPVEYKGKSYEFDTSKITFICLGAFTDLREKKIEEELDDTGHYTMKPEDYINAGLLREIVGRFSLITATKSLNKEDLIRILKESKISPLINLQEMARVVYGIDILYDDEIVEKIAEAALEEDTGARALQTVVNGIRNVVLFDLVQKDSTQIYITDEVLEKANEIYIREGYRKNEI